MKARLRRLCSIQTLLSST